MFEIDKLTIEKLNLLIDYFLENRTRIQKVIDDFGEIDRDNGHGTFFLNPINPFFKVFWFYKVEDEIKSVGFGGPDLGLFLSEIFLQYPNHSQGYVVYDDVYEYVFFKLPNPNYTLKVTSKNKLIDGSFMIKDVPINRLEISLITN